jgi:hypothetical protein
MASTGTLKTIIKYSKHGSLIRPSPNRDELEDHQFESNIRMVIAENTTGNVIPIADKGTVKRILVRTYDGVTDLTLVVNTTQNILLRPLALLSSGVTSLTINNSSLTDSWEIWVTIFYV